MRGIGRTFSRLPAARALIAGAAILAGAAASGAHAQSPGSGNGEDTAMAIPRMNSRGGGIASLPQPLAPSEVARIRHILTLQAQGDVATAARESLALDDTTLL